jgi:hypothetical protein
VLFALHEIQGQLNDLQLTLERLVKPSGSTPEGGPEGGSSEDSGDDVTNGSSGPGSVDPVRRTRSARKFGSSAKAPRLRRSQPRGGFTLRGGDAD